MTRADPASGVLQSGQAFGNYRIERELGRGGMGAVYLAFDTTLRRQVALKVVAGDDNVESRSRVLREARNAAALNHPNICTIHEVGDTTGTAFIAMEYVDGQSLRERMDSGQLSIAETMRIARQAIDALAHAHAHGVVHRDFKAANAIIGSDGRLRVVDFGLSQRRAGVEDDLTTTGTTLTGGAIAGTPYAMAPEQIRGETADARTDIWSLGVLLYEMTAWRRPFDARTTPELLSAILRDEPRPLPPSVPVALQSVIERCLAKEPSQRYQHASEVRAALDAISAGSARAWPAFAHRARRSPALTAAIVMLALTATVAAFNWRQLAAWWAGSPRITSLAVLPLENLSGDPAEDYFADGMTEVLSTDLARLGGLRRVIARGSVVRFKNSTSTPAEIARELGVDALVTGSVQRAGARMSITAQLVDPSSGGQLWTERYERNVEDVLFVRNEIVTAIVNEIRAQLSASERAHLTTARRVNPDAFEAYLKGRFHWLRQTREDYDQAERYYQLAVDKDPEWAMGHAGLGTVWMMRADAGFMPPREALPIANAHFARALALDDGLADLHVALGNQRLISLDAAGAEREYRLAIASNPNHADARFFYADMLLTALARPEAWRPEMERALELDPLNGFIRTYYGWHLNYLRRYDAAIAITQQVLPTSPNRAANHLALWGAYFRTGRFAQAMQSAKDYFQAAGDGEFVPTLGTAVDGDSYRAAMIRAAHAMAARSKSRHVPAARIARMFAHGGDNAAAMRWLLQAEKNQESTLARLAVFWDWDDLRNEPGFKALLSRLKLPVEPLP
jgi:TolB-like protein/tetratricopeptide (TPR) repeat protein/predicted Ser/Thr protein kinase